MSNTVVIRPDETVNHEECDRFARELHQAVEAGSRVVIVDCRAVRYMNSRAIGSLMETYRDLLDRQGMVRVVGPGEFVRRGLEVVGVLSLLEVYETLDEALRARQ